LTSLPREGHGWKARLYHTPCGGGVLALWSDYIIHRIHFAGAGAIRLNRSELRACELYLERFLKNRSRGRQATRTLPQLSIPDPGVTLIGNGKPSWSAAYTPALDGGLREKACSAAFPGQPAKPGPAVLRNFSTRLPDRRALQRASPRSERRSRPIPHGPAAACSGGRLSCCGTFRCGAVSSDPLGADIVQCVKIAAMVRTCRGGLALPRR